MYKGVGGWVEGGEECGGVGGQANTASRQS